MSEERRKGTKLEKEEWEKTGGKEKRKRGKKGKEVILPKGRNKKEN